MIGTTAYRRRRPIHHRYRQGYWRSTNLPDEIWSTAEPAHGLFCCRLDGVVGPNQFFTLEDDEFSMVLLLKFASPSLVCFDFGL